MTGSQTSPSPPEALSKRLATKNKSAKYNSLENIESFWLQMKAKNLHQLWGQFSYVDLIQKSKFYSCSTIYEPATTDSPAYICTL